MHNICLSNVYVKKSVVADGNGVFAAKNIKKKQILEVCPAIFMPIKEFEMIKQTKLFYYFYEYSNKEFAVVLGYGSVYNHSYKPNAQYKFNYIKRVMEVSSLVDLAQDEEIFINYNYYHDDMTPLESWYKSGVDKNH
jgi:SET domain-containing protein